MYKSRFYSRKNRKQDNFNLWNEDINYNKLTQFKYFPTIFPATNKLRVMMGATCNKCLPKAEPPSSEDSLSATLGMTNILKVPTINRTQGLFTRAFYYASFVFSRTADTTYNDVGKKVLSSQKVKEAIRKQVSDEYNHWIEKTSTQHQNADDGYSSSSAKSSSVNAPIDKMKYHELINKHRQRAIEIYENMRSCVSTSLLRIAGWILFKILSRILSTVQIHKGQLEILKRKANEEKIPIVYIPMHRSHLDYILISFILYMNDIKVPLVAAGENLSIPFFGNLMRGLGGFFIKRKHNSCDGKKDYVYRAILQSYMIENVKDGGCLEFFIEGGRSRSGKACMPKAGLLSVIASAIFESEIDDVYIVPVGISYEKILDGNFVSEQLGKKKIGENFTLALKAIWAKLHSHFGNARIDFCQPFSLKDYFRHSKHINLDGDNNALILRNGEDLMSKEKQLKQLLDKENNENLSLVNTLASCVACASSTDKLTLHTTPSLTDFYGLDIVVSEDKRRMIKDLSEHIVYDAFNSTAVMSTQLVAFLLLTKHRKGATLHQLSEGVSWLREEFSKRKRDVGFSGDSIDVARHACNILGKELISCNAEQLPWAQQNNAVQDNNYSVRVNYLKPITKLPSVLELQYYANNCVSVFLLDSIVANALFASIDTDVNSLTGNDFSDISISKKILISKSLELCNILKYDFIFSPPCKKLSDVIRETVDEFLNMGLIDQDDDPIVPHRNHMFGFEVDDFEDDIDGNYYSTEDDIDGKKGIRISLSFKQIELLEFYRCILSPFIESYWLTACTLIKLIGKQKEEKTFLNEVRDLAKLKLSQGILLFEESVAADTLQNSIALFESWNVIDVFESNSVRNYQLSPYFDNKKAINDLIISIENFKK